MKRQIVGIIGDGQLGMLLCQAAPNLGLETVMLTSDHRCAAAQAATRCIEAAMDDVQAITRLIDECDVITYEREDIPAVAIAQLRAGETAAKVACYPPLAVIELLQDKASQKNWLAAKGLATLPYRIVDGDRASLTRAARELEYPMVQKALRGGFDGRGVQVLRDEASLERAWPGVTLLEKYAGKFREIAVLMVRGADGSLAHFGPVDMSFESNYSVLDTVTAPAALDPAVEQQALQLAERAVTEMQGVGVFGVEMFLLEDGSVLINEISPRVHNAGHYTLDACVSSQFEQHLRAVCGLPLASTEQLTPAAMRNILCTEVLLKQAKDHHAGIHDDAGDRKTYWYGKAPARLMRKLGHVTTTASTGQAALNAAVARWNEIQEEAADKVEES